MKDRGQSELIGVMLLTAVVVVAMTMIGLLLFEDMQRNIEGVGPDVDIEGELNESNAIITHNGGDSFPYSDLELRLWSGGDERIYDLADPGDVNTTVGDGDDRFEFGESVVVDHDFTGEVRILLVETTDPGHVLFDETFSFEKTGPKEEPTIEKFEITDTSDNYNASFNVTWNASDIQGDIVEVETELINGGVLEDDNTTSFPEVGITGEESHTLRNESGSGTSYKIKLTVTDADGNTAVDTKVANAGSEIGLRPPDIVRFDVKDYYQGNNVSYGITHNATDPDEDITELEVTLTHESSDTEVDNVTYTFNQTGVTGETTDTLYDPTKRQKGERYLINISVKDAEGNVVSESVTDEADGDDAKGVLQPIVESGVNTQSSRIQLDVENNGSDTVEVTHFSVDATAISPDIQINDGNNREFETEGASVEGYANLKTNDNYFNADGTVYDIKDLPKNTDYENNDYKGKTPKIDPDDGAVTIRFRNFGPDSEYINDSAELTFADSASEADITITLVIATGEESTYYLQVE